MPKHSAKAQVRTSRDYKIMQLIGMDGLASLRMIHTTFWPEAKERTARERLDQLEKAGWLEHHYVDTHNRRGELVFTLTGKGAREHFSEAERRQMMIGLPAPSEIHQQLMVQRARFELEEQLKEQGLHLKAWVNERQLRSEARLAQKPGTRAQSQDKNYEVVDARAIIGDAATGETYQQAIEVDGHYHGKMLRDKIDTLARNPIPVLWVTTPERYERIVSEIEEAEAENIEVMVIEDSSNNNNDD